MGKRVIFTGGSGKAGRHAVPYLQQRGHQVLNLDRVPLDLPGVNTLIVDLADSGQTFNALSTHYGFDEYFAGGGRAPVDAVVRSRLVEPGDMASPQRPVYTLALLHPKWIRAYVSEANLGRIKPGQVARVTTDSAPAHPIDGRVGYIASVAEFTPKNVETEDLRTSLVYEVRINVDDPDDRLRLGMPATVELPGTVAARP